MQIIETPRLVLRPFTPGDAADLFAYLHQPVASCFFSLALADLQAAEQEAVSRSQDEHSVAVCLRDSGKLIGDLFAKPEDDTFMLGWNFNPAFGKQGHAHEAAAALFAHLFTAGAARRLYAYVEDTNAASQKLCERLGMRQEGIFKEFVTFQNDAHGAPIYENTMQYALLRHEWVSQQGQQPANDRA
jgi:RimJ/RimL family protein N-acetyltransferase